MAHAAAHIKKARSEMEQPPDLKALEKARERRRRSRERAERRRKVPHYPSTPSHPCVSSQCVPGKSTPHPPPAILISIIICMEQTVQHCSGVLTKIGINSHVLTVRVVLRTECVLGPLAPTHHCQFGLMVIGTAAVSVHRPPLQWSSLQSPQTVTLPAVGVDPQISGSVCLLSTRFLLQGLDAAAQRRSWSGFFQSVLVQRTLGKNPDSSFSLQNFSNENMMKNDCLEHLFFSEALVEVTPT